MKKQLGGGRGGGAEAGGRRALWCNAGSESGRSLLCGGEQECDSCLSDGVVLYSCLLPLLQPLEVMLQCERARRLFACLCLFLIAARAAFRFLILRAPEPRMCGAAPPHPHSNKHTRLMLCHTPASGSGAAGKWQRLFFFSCLSSGAVTAIVWTSPLWSLRCCHFASSQSDISDVVMENSSLLCDRIVFCTFFSGLNGNNGIHL